MHLNWLSGLAALGHDVVCSRTARRGPTPQIKCYNIAVRLQHRRASTLTLDLNLKLRPRLGAMFVANASIRRQYDNCMATPVLN